MSRSKRAEEKRREKYRIFYLPQAEKGAENSDEPIPAEQWQINQQQQARNTELFAKALGLELRD